MKVMTLRFALPNPNVPYPLLLTTPAAGIDHQLSQN
jgi:hypothetical protein